MPAPSIADAVRDTVTVRGPTDYTARNRVARSHTAQQVPVSFPTIPGSSYPQSILRATKAVQSSLPLPRPRQRQSQKQAQERFPARRCHRPPRFYRRRAQYVLPSLHVPASFAPVFHHDGPFDACAPSRNRQRSNAPMFAWSPRHDDLAPTDSPASKPFSAPDPPKKKVDAIAEAWGIHEPEPFQEFFAGGGSGKADDTPASSIYNGRDKRTPRDNRPSPPPDPTRQAKRSLPPPQPIFDDPPPLSPGANPQRKKSLMQRIRKMRDAPNVPVTAEYDQPPSPSPSSDPIIPRPTHRPQNSFLGRFAASRTEKSEPFVYIEPTNKELPPPPPDFHNPSEVAGYFDSPNPTDSRSPGIVRKTSLMKKVGRVVARNRQ